MDTKVLVMHFNPKSPISEAYRVLRTNIQYSGIDKTLKTIVITSSGPGEGKTTTIVNLSITFAQMGSRVLLIDADLRKPKIHRMFGLSNSTGLLNIIARHDDYKKYLNKYEVKNLDVITSGAIPPNPSELLSSNSMKQFIDQVKEDYDMVFIDSPPVCSVTDAAILSTITDGTILVAASGIVEIDALTSAKELLEKVKANIIGVVLNKIEKSTMGGYYHYYHSYYSEDEKPSQSRHMGKGKHKSKERLIIADNDD